MKSEQINRQRPSAFIPGDTAPIQKLIQELQDTRNEGNAYLFNASFSADVLWGSPFGAIVSGYEPIHAIHQQMLASVRNSNAKVRYKADYIRFLSETVAIAFVRKIIVDTDENFKEFNELALFVFMKKESLWWIAAAQHLSDKREVYDAK